MIGPVMDKPGIVELSIVLLCAAGSGCSATSPDRPGAEPGSDVRNCGIETLCLQSLPDWGALGCSRSSICGSFIERNRCFREQPWDACPAGYDCITYNTSTCVGAPIGHWCQNDLDCGIESFPGPRRGVCLHETNREQVSWPDGYCSALCFSRNNDPATGANRDCTSSRFFTVGVCAPIDSRDFCLVHCRDDSDCRSFEGYRCGTFGDGGVSGCAPWALVVDAGQPVDQVVGAD